MNKKRIIKITYLFLLLCASFSLVILSMLAEGISDEPVWSKVEVSETYKYGTEFEIPKRALTVGGATVNAEGTLIYPDGSANTQSVKLLDQNGKYLLRYAANIDGKSYYDEISFVVTARIAEYGAGTTLSYGLPNGAEKDAGLMVSLAKGDTIVFNKVIDLSDITKSEQIFEGYVAPTTKGTLEFTDLVFKITDIYDPDNYVTLNAKTSISGVKYPWTFWTVGANGQYMAGKEHQKNIIHINNEWGNGQWHSFYGIYNNPADGYDPGAYYDTHKLSFAYEWSERAFYLNEGSMGLLADLDSSEFYTTLWNGFSSGKVRISITTKGCTMDRGNFVITKLFGIDLTDTLVEDNDAPSITVDTEYEDMPDAAVGMKYLIPGASAFDDFDGRVDVNATVWYNYGTSSSIMSQINDESFIPDRVGLYAIEYEATDLSGNSSVLVKYIRVREAIDKISIVLPSDTAVSGKVFDSIPLPTVTTTGGSGNIDISYALMHNGETVEIEDSFVPDDIGEYTVVIFAKDYIEQTVKTKYTVNVYADAAPMFPYEPKLPTAFISGASYKLEPLVAYDFSSGGKKEIVSAIEITDANGTFTLSAGESYIPSVKNNGDKITVKYTVDGVGVEKQITGVCAYVDGALHVENFLITDSLDFATSIENITITANTSNAGFKFTNSLLIKNFEFNFEAIPEKSDFEALRFIFRDADDASNGVEMIFSCGGANSIWSNGNNSLVLDSGFASSSKSNSFTIEYKNGSFYICGAAVKTDASISGGAFTGFTSSSVFMEVYFVNAVKGSSYSAVSLNGQLLNSVTSDRKEPKVVITSDYGGQAALGERVFLPPMIAMDVLDPNVTFTFTVTTPKGKTVTATDGTLLRNADPTKGYYITVEEFGQYLISYKAEDTSKRKMSGSYVINVMDDIAPTISFKQDFVTTVSVGRAICIPEWTVSDNISSADDIIVSKCIVNPLGNVIALPRDSNSLLTSNTGIYEIRIIVCDKAGNITLVTQKITVQ